MSTVAYDTISQQSPLPHLRHPPAVSPFFASARVNSQCLLNPLPGLYPSHSSQVFESHGFAPLEAEYLETWLHSGQRVLAQDPQVAPGSSAAGTAIDPMDPVPLTIRGLSAQGFLLAEDDRGRPYELTPDGNSLDMMQGLIKRKV